MKSYFRGLAYKVLRGGLSTAAGAALVFLTATPFGWVLVPIVGAIGKAIRIRLEKNGRDDLVKWVVI